jgi:hypothetical protein
MIPPCRFPSQYAPFSESSSIHLWKSPVNDPPAKFPAGPLKSTQLQSYT